MDRRFLIRAMRGLTDEQLVAIIHRELGELDRRQRLRGEIGADEPGLYDRFVAAAADARDGYLNTLRAAGGAGMEAARAGRDFMSEGLREVRNLSFETAAMGADGASAAMEVLGERAGNAAAGLGSGVAEGADALAKTAIENADLAAKKALENFDAYLEIAGVGLLVVGVGALLVTGGAGYVLMSGGGQALLSGAGQAVGTGVGGLLSGAGQAAGGTVRAVGTIGAAVVKAA